MAGRLGEFARAEEVPFRGSFLLELVVERVLGLTLHTSLRIPFVGFGVLGVWFWCYLQRTELCGQCKKECDRGRNRQTVNVTKSIVWLDLT